MQVILLEKVINLGDLGDVVKVRDGYARNYLVPQGIARRATATAIKEFEERRAELEKQQAEKLAAAQAVGEKLNGYVLNITQKSGVDGRLFGSVTNIDVTKGLQAGGFEEVNKSQIRMPEGAIKAVGEYPLQVVLHADVTSEITVNVIGEMA